MKTASYILILIATLMLSACQKQEAETDNEPQVAATCDDGIMNQGETDIDCGGPCPLCQATMTAMVDADTFKAVFNTITSKYANGAFFVSGSSDLGSLTIIYSGSLSIGTVSNAQATFVKNSTSVTYIASTANLTFNTINVTDSTAEGMFSFNAINFNSPTDTVKVMNGFFKRISIKNN
ncbi:MAG: hypothetical protein V9G42_01485 [Bacteroidia bacterium]